MASVASSIPGPLSPRQPNPQFANTKYQRTPPAAAAIPAVLGRPPAVAPVASAKPVSSADEPSSFIFLKDGIHFPQPVPAAATASRAACPAPVNVLTGFQPQLQSSPGRQLGMVDLAVDLLPHDFELIPFLQVSVFLMPQN
jgi:hypothetical protein